MSTLTGLVLPAPFTDAEQYAGWQYSRRIVALTVHGPGVFHRNRYAIAWVTIVEDRRFKGEPLRLQSERRAESMEVARSGFTEPARRALDALLLPAIARHGFDRFWTDAHRARAGSASATITAYEHRARMAARSKWWDDVASLTELYGDGMLDLDPVERGPDGRDIRVAVLTSHTAGIDWHGVVARLMLDDEHVGWMTADGTLAPLETEAIR